jgi:hypothetical protein
MFSSTTTESSISREKASAKPLNSMTLIEPPMAFMSKKHTNAERGMERSTAKVARGLPRKMRIMMPVSTSPIPPSFITFLMALLTKMD